MKGPGVLSYCGGEIVELVHGRVHAIEYGQCHQEPVWAHERPVSLRGPEGLVLLVEEVCACIGRKPFRDVPFCGWLRTENGIRSALRHFVGSRAHPIGLT